jgi:periplasmic copper chaperone A
MSTSLLHAPIADLPRHAERRGRRVLAVLALSVTVVLGACSGQSGGSGAGADRDGATGTPVLEVSSAQASGPIAGASQLVVEVHNRGDGDDRLIGAESDAALAVEVHRTEITDDGRALMRKLDDVALPAGETVRFRPGGLHLMLVVPDERVVVGGTFEVTLRFERSAPVTISVTVVELLDLVEDADPTDPAR